MWSNLYWYYEIRKDDGYSEALSPEVAVNVLIKKNVFKQIGPQSFENRNGSPFTSICCVYQDSNGGYSHHITDSTKLCNLVTVVVSKIEEVIEPHYIDTLIQIARELKWELILEEDNSGNQNIELYLPEL